MTPPDLEALRPQEVAQHAAARERVLQMQLVDAAHQRQFGSPSDPSMEEALHRVPQNRELAGLDNLTTRLPDESTMLRFRHLLAKHKLAVQNLALINDMLRDKGLKLRAGPAVDAILICR